MDTLTRETIDAHGGLALWRQFEHGSAHLRTGGVLWPLKPQPGILDDVHVRVALHRSGRLTRRSSSQPGGRRSNHSGWRSKRPTDESSRTPHSPHVVRRPWPRDAVDRLHLAYFAAMRCGPT